MNTGYVDFWAPSCFKTWVSKSTIYSDDLYFTSVRKISGRGRRSPRGAAVLKSARSRPMSPVLLVLPKSTHPAQAALWNRRQLTLPDAPTFSRHVGFSRSRSRRRRLNQLIGNQSLRRYYHKMLNQTIPWRK